MAGIMSMPSVWTDLNMAGQNQQQLLDKEELARKKKLMAAGGTDYLTASQLFFGQHSPGGSIPLV